MARTILTPEQIEDEYKAIKKLGPFENLLLVTGENPAKAGVPYLAKALDIAKKYFSNLKIEVMPLKAEEYAELVKNTEIKKGANALMKNKIIGVCPNCGANVVEIGRASCRERV